jgi:hypothetical protein
MTAFVGTILRSSPYDIAKFVISQITFNRLEIDSSYKAEVFVREIPKDLLSEALQIVENAFLKNSKASSLNMKLSQGAEIVEFFMRDPSALPKQQMLRYIHILENNKNSPQIECQNHSNLLDTIKNLNFTDFLTKTNFVEKLKEQNNNKTIDTVREVA